MKRKKYEVPAMEVVEFEQQQHLLAGSVGATRGEDYGNAIEETWE